MKCNKTTVCRNKKGQFVSPQKAISNTQQKSSFGKKKQKKQAKTGKVLKVPEKWILYFKRGLSRGIWDKRLEFAYRANKSWLESTLYETKRKKPEQMYKEGYKLGYTLNDKIPAKVTEQRQWLEKNGYIKVTV